ncbi:MAG: hypothetical protein NTX79_02365 [Candidatus Micrarchaeota archaeon]|nr:hypothetical protein [Candidatus Micrarchaeota archaeon]
MHPPRQPKREIAEYVRKNGILVPDIYDSFRDARKAESSGRKVRARSEHPQDYNGVSGMLESPLLSNPSITDEKSLKLLIKEGDFMKNKGFMLHIGHIHMTMERGRILDRLLYNLKEDAIMYIERKKKEKRDLMREPGNSSHNAGRYCELLGVDERKFWKKASFSYWEEIDGNNLTIVADSCIKGRYHILVHNPITYAILENGKVAYLSHSAPDDVMQCIVGSPDFYEKVRSLPMFSAINCPVIEAEHLSGNHYFLQYLLGRDFDPVDFALDRPPGKNEIAALYCRGSTLAGHPDGEIISVKRLYSMTKQIPHDGESCMHSEGISMMLSELALRRQNVNFMLADSIFKQSDRETAIKSFFYRSISHTGVSRLFKPKISLLMFASDFDKRDNKEEFQAKVIADGRKAYVELL